MLVPICYSVAFYLALDAYTSTPSLIQKRDNPSAELCHALAMHITVFEDLTSRDSCHMQLQGCGR